MPLKNQNMSVRYTFGKGLKTVEGVLALADIEISSDTAGKEKILSFANCCSLDEADIRYSAQHNSCIWRNPDTEIHAPIQNQAIRAFADYRGIRWLCHFTDRKNLPDILKNGLLPRNLLPDTAAVSDPLRFDRCADSLCLSVSLHNHWMLNKKIEQGIIDPCLILLSPRILWEKQCAFYPHNAATACYRNIPFEGMSGLYRFKAMFDPVISFQKANGTSGMWARQNHQHFCEPTSQQAEVQCLQAIEPAYILYVIERNPPPSYDGLAAMIDNWPACGQTVRISAAAEPSGIEAKPDAVFDGNPFDIADKLPAIGRMQQQAALPPENTKPLNQAGDKEISVIQSIKEYMAEVRREQVEGKEARMEKFRRELEEDQRKHDQEYKAKMAALKKQFEALNTEENNKAIERMFNDMGISFPDTDSSLNRIENGLQTGKETVRSKREMNITHNKQKVEHQNTEGANTSGGCTGFLSKLISVGIIILVASYIYPLLLALIPIIIGIILLHILSD